MDGDEEREGGGGERQAAYRRKMRSDSRENFFLGMEEKLVKRGKWVSLRIHVQWGVSEA